MDLGRVAGIYFPELVFIETEPCLSVGLNRGSCVEEAVDGAGARKQKPADKQETQNPSSFIPPPLPLPPPHTTEPRVEVVPLASHPRWMTGRKQLVTHQQMELIIETIPAGKTPLRRFFRHPTPSDLSGVCPDLANE